MRPQHPTANSEHTSTLDTQLNSIRAEFDRLNKELNEARKERDEYKTSYRIKAKELHELKQIVSHRAPYRDCIVCHQCKGEIAHTCKVTGDFDNPSSPESWLSEYHSILEAGNAISDHDRLDNAENLSEIDRSDGETEEREITGAPTTTTSEIASVSSESNATTVDEPQDPGWHIEVNNDAETALNLNLLHKFTEQDVSYVNFSMDGKLLATVSEIHGTVRIFDVETGERISIMRDLYEKPDSDVFYECLCLSPDNKYLATGSNDGQIKVWTISKRRVRNVFSHERPVYALDFSPNGQSIVACSIDGGTVRIWRLRDGFCRILIGIEYPWAVQFSPDERYIASGDYFGPIAIWKVRTGRRLARWQGHRRTVRSLVFTPDGKGLLSASWDKMVIHWDVSSLSSLGITRLDADDREEADVTMSSWVTEISRLVGHTDRVWSLSVSRDGKWIASGSADRTVRIWSAHDSTLQCIMRGGGVISSVDFSQLGNYLTIGDRTGQVTIWNYANP